MTDSEEQKLEEALRTYIADCLRGFMEASGNVPEPICKEWAVDAWIKGAKWQSEQDAAREKELVDALKKHHDWHLRSDVLRYITDNGEVYELNLEEAYSESDMCDETISALKAHHRSGE